MPQAPPQTLDQSSSFKKDSPSDLSFNVRSISGWELLVWITPSLNSTPPSDALKQFVLHTHFISPQQNWIFLLSRACLNPLKLCWYVKPSMLKSVTFKPSDAESVTAGYMCVCTCVHWGFPDGSDRKQSACNAGDLGQEDPLEKRMVTHSRLPGEISLTSDMQMTPPLWQEVMRNSRASWWRWNRRVKKLA